MKLTRTRIALAVVATLACGGVALASLKPGIFSSSSKDAASGAANVLAVVNRQAVTAADVEAFMATGLAKPVAVENAINRSLAAESARQLWPADAQAIADSAAREALAGFFVRKKLDELQHDVSDKDIAQYYDANVKDELYSGSVLKYYLTQDAKDAVAMAEAVKQNEAATLNKFSWVNKDGDHAVLPAGVPYGLYQQVKTLQPGQYLGPWRVKDGVLFLKLEERKAGKRPDLPKVKDEIKQMLAQQRLESALKDLRDHAKIELK